MSKICERDPSRNYFDLLSLAAGLGEAWTAATLPQLHIPIVFLHHVYKATSSLVATSQHLSNVANVRLGILLTVRVLYRLWNGYNGPHIGMLRKVPNLSRSAGV